MDILNTQGFILIKGGIKPEQCQFLDKLYVPGEDKVHYPLIKEYIDNVYFPTVKKELNISDKINYHKFRFSNNNNSTDASTFHNDLYNFSNLELMPVYTCLTYFDEAQMELIPTSHLRSNRQWNKCMCNYRKKIEIDIPKNSILIFNSALFHRGKGFSTKGNRRLLQVFECFLSEKDYANYSSRIIVVQTNQNNVVRKLGDFSKLFSTNSFLLDNYTFFHYFITYYNMQYKMVMIDLPPNEKNEHFLVYEPSSRINYTDVNEPLPTNMNIICDTTIKKQQPSSFYFYLFLLFIVLVIALVYFCREKKGKRLPRKLKRK